jgi:hypothetical protein
LNDGIKFHDPEAPDPDWKVKLGYLLMLASTSEADVGVENLWKRGKSGGRHEHADFGKYMPKNYYKAFQNAAASMFMDDESKWHKERCNVGWEVFMPALKSFNEKRSDQMVVIMAILDESIAGWLPKTSKTGGLPNISHEPRKPVSLGTLFRNCAECITGCFVYQDIQMHPEIQRTKEFFYSDVANRVPELTALPMSEEMSAHSAEVLRQVKGAGVKEGGWICGDAWFGSVMSAVECYRRLGVHSTLVIKGNNKYFPQAALRAVLLARHGTRPAGHWVVMTTEIGGVFLIAICYAWSQQRCSYFISTCGSTTAHPIKYETSYEDEWGQTAVRYIDRPNIVHMTYMRLPEIDEINKQRQAIVGGPTLRAD